MSARPWTDGPWRLWGHASPSRVIASASAFVAQTVAGNDTANARLISAAPDLAEALIDMLSGWRYIRETHGDLYGVGWDRAEDNARAALAKAGVK